MMQLVESLLGRNRKIKNQKKNEEYLALRFSEFGDKHTIPYDKDWHSKCSKSLEMFQEFKDKGKP